MYIIVCVLFPLMYKQHLVYSFETQNLIYRMPPKTAPLKKKTGPTGSKVVPKKPAGSKVVTKKPSATKSAKPSAEKSAPVKVAPVAAPVAAPIEPPKPVAFVRAIKIKELAKVVLEDEIVGAKPILLAETGGTNIASTFLRYRDVNYLSILNSNEMEPERIRKAILGGVRYGKPVVFDMDDANLFDQLEVFINRVLPDLFQHILDWSILDSTYS